MNEKEKVDLFHLWLIKHNPKISTCIDLMRAIDNFIIYKMTILKMLEDSKNAMDYDFEEIMQNNFPYEKK